MKHASFWAGEMLPSAVLWMNLIMLLVLLRHILFCSLLSIQNGLNLSQLLWGPLMKFGGKVQKIFWTQTFGLGKILYPFILLMNKIFCSKQILQLPSLKFSNYILINFWNISIRYYLFLGFCWNRCNAIGYKVMEPLQTTSATFLFFSSISFSLHFVFVGSTSKSISKLVTSIHRYLWKID